MKYNNYYFNKILEIYNQDSNNLGLENITEGYITMIKNGSKIYIKKKNRGKFSDSAKKAGMSVQEYAHKVINSPNSTKLQRKRAQFAINAKKFKH